MTTYSPIAIANYFIDRSINEGERVNQMQLQKLVYLAYAWHMARTGERLTWEQPEAWRYGPTFPSLYRAAAAYGSGAIMSFIITHNERYFTTEQVLSFDHEIEASLRAVWDKYKSYSLVELMMLTHRPGTPWSKAYDRQGDSTISDEDILGHWKELLNSSGDNEDVHERRTRVVA